MTKDNWIKAFEKKFKNGWKFSKLITGEGVTESDIKTFISQVEKDAEERGYQLGLRDGIKKEHENSGAWTDLNKQGVINTHKLIKDAIEKTNKRWRERIERLKYKPTKRAIPPVLGSLGLTMYWSRPFSEMGRDTVGEYEAKKYNGILSDVLTGINET